MKNSFMRIDLHCHSYYSDDGISSPEKIIKTALKKGLDGIALTDHDTTNGWREAIEAAEKLKAVLVLGEEIKTKKGDILGLFLKNKINGKGENPFKVIKEIKKQGGIAIIAHPYHFPENFKDDLIKYKYLVDGIEVFNAKLPIALADKKAFNFAKTHNLSMIGGSDSHYHSKTGDGWTAADVGNIEDFKKAILNRQTKTGGKKSPLPFFYLVYSTLARLGLIKKPKSIRRQV